MDDAARLRDMTAAGWSEADLEWERLGEMALSELAEGREDNAFAAIRQALYLARTEFVAGDPRLAASLTNQAAAVAATTPDTPPETISRGALQAWMESERLVATLAAPRRARSSLFHLRMERLHRETYESRWRDDVRARLAEARAGLGLADGAPPLLIGRAQAQARLAHWLSERPDDFSDTRKLLGALLLLAARTDRGLHPAQSDPTEHLGATAKGGL